MTAPRPFRFSLQVPRATSRREWVELARRAEDTGFDMVVTADHLGGLSPLVPLAVAAEATERLRVGTMVLNNDFYTPSLLARDVATLDLLSDGRMELGLGAGHARPEYERAGLAGGPPGGVGRAPAPALRRRDGHPPRRPLRPERRDRRAPPRPGPPAAPRRWRRRPGSRHRRPLGRRRRVHRSRPDLAGRSPPRAGRLRAAAGRRAGRPGPP